MSSDAERRTSEQRLEAFSGVGVAILITILVRELRYSQRFGYAQVDVSPAVSPDGRRLAYASNASRASRERSARVGMEAFRHVGTGCLTTPVRPHARTTNPRAW